MRTLVLTMFMLLVVAGCGGDTAGPSEEETPVPQPSADGDTAAASPIVTESTTTTSTVVEDEEEAATPTDPGGTVILGDTTYYFTVGENGTCDPDFYGTFRAFMQQVDQSGAPLVGQMTISANAAGEGIIGGEVDGVLWSVAEADEGSSIDSVQIDGNRLTGTATFVSPDTGESAAGSFEVTCAGE